MCRQCCRRTWCVVFSLALCPFAIQFDLDNGIRDARLVESPSGHRNAEWNLSATLPHEVVDLHVKVARVTEPLFRRMTNACPRRGVSKRAPPPLSQSGSATIAEPHSLPGMPVVCGRSYAFLMFDFDVNQLWITKFDMSLLYNGTHLEHTDIRTYEHAVIFGVILIWVISVENSGT